MRCVGATAAERYEGMGAHESRRQQKEEDQHGIVFLLLLLIDRNENDQSQKVSVRDLQVQWQKVAVVRRRFMSAFWDELIDFDPDVAIGRTVHSTPL